MHNAHHVPTHITWISTRKEWTVYSSLNWQSVTEIQVHAAQMQLFQAKQSRFKPSKETKLMFNSSWLVH
jgi:hypothetical protein